VLVTTVDLDPDESPAGRPLTFTFCPKTVA